MAKPVTFEFEDKTYELSKELLEEYENSPHSAFQKLLHEENPFDKNPFDPVFTGGQWWAYEHKRFAWYSAACDRAHKYKFGWRFFLKQPFIWAMVPWLVFAIVTILR